MSSLSHAQKAKFKMLRASCQKGRLPTNYVAPENRTYIVYSKGAYAQSVEDRNGGLYGWTPVYEDPYLEAAVSIYGFRINPAKRSDQKKEKKDKEGNVTDRWREYTYTGSAVGKATLYIYGESETFEYSRKSKSALAAEARKKAKAEEKKADLSDNPFLTADDVEESEDAGESSISEDVGLEDAQLPLAQTLRLDVSTSVKSRAYRTTRAAYKDYVENQKPRLYDFRDAYPAQVYQKAINRLNSAYGYSPVNYVVSMQAMKSEKHPDYQMWNDACQAAETLFKTFRFNASIADMQKKFDPIIAYFNQQVESIDDGDKKAKRTKKAAFNNLINIMYFLDRQEQVLTLCQMHEDSKLLGRSAGRMIDKAKRQVALMAFHNVKSCHFEELNELVVDEVETIEESVSDGDGR